MKSFAETIKDFVDGQIQDMCCAVPALVESYDANTCKASVRPVINKIFADGTSSPYGVISAVPVIFPRTKKFSFTFPLVKDDGVLLVFTDRSMEEYLASKDSLSVNPSDSRSHDLTDAVALVGLFPFGVANTSKNIDAVELNNGTTRITMLDNGELQIHADTKVLLTADTVEVTSDSILLGSGTLDKLATKAFVDDVLLSLATGTGHIHPVAGASTGGPTVGMVPNPLYSTTKTEAA